MLVFHSKQTHGHAKKTRKIKPSKSLPR